MRVVKVEKGCFIPIGRLGENEATLVIFDVSDWKTIYGEGVFVLMCQRNGEPAPYIATTEQTETEVRWIVTNTDVAIKGSGKCELIYTVNDTVVKSEIYITVVGDALHGGIVPPEPWEDWVKRVLEAGEHAHQSAQAAASSAQAAEEAVTHYPKISEVNSHWLVWDSTEGKYTDTGIVAEGQDGEKGDKGDPGGGVAKGGRAGQILAKKSNADYDTEWVDSSAGGASSWQEVQNKPFESVGSNLLVEDGVLKVDTTNNAEEDNTRPITSAGTYTIVGNINTLLNLI